MPYLHSEPRSAFIDDRRFKDVSIKGQVLTSWPLYADVLEADKIINIPIAKHHGLAKLTMSMKNWMGIMGGQRGRIHQKIGECLADICLVVKPTLTVLDAVRVLTTNGPQGGSLTDVKRLDTVIVGIDQVGIDSYGATLFGMKGSDLSYVKAGAAAGTGRYGPFQAEDKEAECLRRPSERLHRAFSFSFFSSSLFRRNQKVMIRSAIRSNFSWTLIH